MKIEDIPQPVLDKIKEYAFLQYNVNSIIELKNKIVDQQFEIIVNKYLSEVLLRISRIKKDEAKWYIPTDDERIDYLQSMIDAMQMEGHGL